MAGCVLHACLILALANLAATNLTDSQKLTSQDSTENEERVLKFTIRIFTNPHGRWVSQVQLQREGFPEKGDVPRAQFRVEQNLGDSTRPPRLFARLAAGSLLDGEVEVLEGERFELVSPQGGWEAARDACSVSGQLLAEPSPALFQWLSGLRTHELQNETGLVSRVYVGVTNYNPGMPFETVRGQKVANGTEPLTSRKKLCGAFHIRNHALSMENCDLHLPFVCEAAADEHNTDTDTQNPKGTLDLGIWLKQELTDEDENDYESEQFFPDQSLEWFSESITETDSTSDEWDDTVF